MPPVWASRAGVRTVSQTVQVTAVVQSPSSALGVWSAYAPYSMEQTEQVANATQVAVPPVCPAVASVVVTPQTVHTTRVVQSPSSASGVWGRGSPYSLPHTVQVARALQVASPPVCSAASVITVRQTVQVIGVVQSPSSSQGVWDSASMISFSNSPHFSHWRLLRPSETQVGLLIVVHSPQTWSQPPSPSSVSQPPKQAASSRITSTPNAVSNLLLVFMARPPSHYFFISAPDRTTAFTKAEFRRALSHHIKEKSRMTYITLYHTALANASYFVKFLSRCHIL